MTNTALSADVLVIGGGLGGIAAAITAAKLGRSVIIVERSNWLGGQLTTQAVPPDEHAWIETELASPSYQQLRTAIRDHYRRVYPLIDTEKLNRTLNPGMGNVSRLCHEPRVAVSAIAEMLSPFIASGMLSTLMGAEIASVEIADRRITSVTVQVEDTHCVVSGDMVIDATEEGEFLEIAGLPFVTGAESRNDTGELHAPEKADPLDQQAISWCVALEYRTGEDHTIPKPDRYDYWLTAEDARWPGSQLSWADIVPDTLETRVRPLFAESPERAEEEKADDLWQYRRILSRKVLDASFAGGEITLVNWPQIDYWELPLHGVSAEDRQRALNGARDLTLSFVYWMQTAAPRHDGGTGYPELRVRGDVTGTLDGLAKEAYIRESRRIRALFTITEGHIGREMRGSGAGSEIFFDSVGIGYYRIDLHPSTSGRTYVDIDCFPFQIPLGALIPEQVDNLLAGAKNIGSTHITNGAYRLHPVEWSIGEAAGAVAAQSITTGGSPEQIRNDSVALATLQRTLSEELGITLSWPDRIRRGGAPFDQMRESDEAID